MASSDNDNTHNNGDGDNGKDAPPSTEEEVTSPNSTLYVSNIDWSIKKPLLRRSLHTLFGRHGKILEIVALRRDGLRGQAFVLFQQVAAATAAVRSENGFSFFGRPLKVAYAREKSDRIAKLEGTFVPQKERRRLRRLDKRKEPPVDQKNDDNDDDDSQAPKRPRLAGTDDPAASAATTTDKNNNAHGGDATSTHTDGPPPPPPPPPPSSGDQTSESASSHPTHVLFADNLPSNCTQSMLQVIFRQYSGFVEVRLPRPGLAFIEYNDEPHATLAFRALQGFELTATDSLHLQYAKTT